MGDMKLSQYSVFLFFSSLGLLAFIELLTKIRYVGELIDMM